MFLFQFWFVFLDVFTLAEHNAEKAINYLEKGAYGSFACETAVYSTYLFIILRFIKVSESLNGPFINQMSQRHTVYLVAAVHFNSKLTKSSRMLPIFPIRAQTHQTTYHHLWNRQSRYTSRPQYLNPLLERSWPPFSGQEFHVMGKFIIRECRSAASGNLLWQDSRSGVQKSSGTVGEFVA